MSDDRPTAGERPPSHHEIDALQLVERYVAGRLPEEEAERFEAHLVGCDRCLDAVETAERLGTALRAHLRREPIAAELETAPPARPRWRPGGRARALAAIAAGLVAALLPGGVAFYRLHELGGELAGLQSEAAAARGEAAELRERLARETAAAAAGRQREAALAGELAGATRPQGNVALLFLGPVRGDASSAPTHRLERPEPPGWIVLALELDGPSEASYQATIRGPGGGELLLTARGLRLNELGALTLSLHSATLVAGDYLVEARDESGSARASFRFRVETGAVALPAKPPA